MGPFALLDSTAMRIRPFSVAFALLLIVSLSGPGCNKSGPSRRALKVHLAGEPVTLDPSLAEDGLSLRVISNVMEGLVGYDGAGAVQDQLASTHSVSPDGKRYVFQLREGLRWSDGVRLEPQHFITGIKRSLSPDTPSKLAELLMPIRGARAYKDGRSKELPGLKIQDGRLIFELERSAPYFLQTLTLPVAMPQRSDILDAHQGRWPVAGKAHEAAFTGAYRIVSHSQDQRYLLEGNEHHRNGPPRIYSVDLLVLSDESTAVALFDQGKLDILTRVPTVDFPRLKQRGVMRTDPFVATYYLAFNARKPPFDDIDWRRAVAAAIDKKGLAESLLTGEFPARGWVPKGVEGYIPPEAPAPDFSAAVRKVRGAKKPSVSVQFDSSARNAMVLEKVQQDLKRILGLEVSLQNLDWKTHIKQVQTDPPQVYRFGWLAPFIDPISHLEAWTTGNPNNNARYSNREYDRIVSQVAAAVPGPGREKLVVRAQKILLDDDVALVPLYHYVQNHAVSASVANFRVNAMGVIRFDELDWSDGSR